jgi:glyoxylase-like metal-dependent hydrolase (beta-lactamase superfamily II)
MPGTWTVSRAGPLQIHTFTAPEEGWLVNSHILEFSSQLFVVDAQYTLPFAREVAGYAANLRKPINRLYVTHYHPDHLLGAAAFATPLFALDSVARKIAQVGDRIAAEEHEKIGNDIPTKARQAEHIVAEGLEIIDGLQVNYRRVRCAETEDALVIAMPSLRTIIVQDLVYNHAHLFLGERNFDGWRNAVRNYQTLPYEIVLPGHGLPGDKRLYDDMITYLDFAQNALAQSNIATEFKQRLLERFPSHGCRKILDHELRFLFPQKEKQDV